jgi:hypothetical protein
MNHKTEIPAADTRVFGAAIRKALKQLGLPYKVRLRDLSVCWCRYRKRGTAYLDALPRDRQGNPRGA